jgi:HEAT repeat protein
MMGGAGKLIERLKTGTSLERENAKERIILSGGKKTVEILVPLLKSRNVELRMHVHEILCRTGGKNLGAIANLLMEEDEELRIFACEIMGTLKVPEALASLLQALKDESPNVRTAAINALSGFQGEAVVDALMSALEDEPWVCFAAITSLGKLRPRRAIPSLLRILKSDDGTLSSAALEALISLEDKAVLKEIVSWLDTLSPGKRERYMTIMLESGKPNPFRALREKMEEAVFLCLLSMSRQKKRKDPQILRRLASFQRKEALEEILDSFSSSDPDSEEYESLLDILSGARALRNHVSDIFALCPEELLPPLLKACARGRVKIEDAVLLRRFEEGSVETRREIASAIASLSKTPERLIELAIKDSDGHVRKMALGLVKVYGLKNLVPEVISIARRDYFDVRVEALKALIDLDSAKAEEIIMEFVEKGSAQDKKVYLEAAQGLGAERNYPFLKRLLEERDNEIRRWAIRLIGNYIEEQRYLELLRKEIQKEDFPPDLAKVVREKRLSVFKDRLREVFMDEKKDLWVRYQALLALSDLDGKGSKDLFILGLKDRSPLIKVASIKALLDSGCKDSVDSVLPLLKDRREEVRAAARKFLEQMGIL